ncbi:unnamed protein product [Trichogramma brassicae]|uniref:Meckelin n=1 Tax=Trichogramma brassicae TaxID=86971 RepID=A0A6H5I284_9HYME|nr:unnamed protein product [Trichogramma brassicae]
MFYEESGYPVVANNKIIPLKYTLDKDDGNNRLNFSLVAFGLDGRLRSLDTPNLFCTFLNDVRFGINVNKQCRVYAKELTSREMLFFSPYLLFADKAKSYLSTLPVFTKNKLVAIGVLAGLAVMYSALKAWGYCKRNHNGILKVGVVAWFFIYCLGAIGNVLLLVTTSVCVYIFIFYKGQTVLHILLPADSVETKIYLCTIIAFCFKLVELAALIYRHRNINVFFIDWEQPRVIAPAASYDSPHTSLKKLYDGRFEPDGASKRSKKKSDGSSAEESPREEKMSDQQLQEEMPPPAPSSDRVQQLPVSIWRTYFVANEWFKIQTKRRINIALQIIFTLFMLEIVGLKYWTQPTPELQTDENENSTNEKNFTLRYGVGALVYMFCYTVQWIISITFYERYVKNRMQHFVDLCSVANVSMFIFAYNYYGYYIHGRSVHGYADTDLETLINDLKKEENNLCAHREFLTFCYECIHFNDVHDHDHDHAFAWDAHDNRFPKIVQLQLQYQSVSKDSLTMWMKYLTSQPRSASLINDKHSLVNTIKESMQKYLGEVKITNHIPDKREPEVVFYDATKATINVYSVKPAVFDLILTIAILVYLGFVYLVVYNFSKFYNFATKISSGKSKSS